MEVNFEKFREIKNPSILENVHGMMALNHTKTTYLYMIIEAVDLLKKWLNDNNRDDWKTNAINDFIELNKDNEEVMKYLLM